MKAYVAYGNGRCGFEELPIPSYGDYEVLVKLESCGVCNGTDLKIIHGTFKGVEDYPAVLGHEGVGRVVELGAKVRSFQKGDLILMPYIGQTPAGMYSAWGTYAEYNVAADAAAMEADGLLPEPFAYGQQRLPGDLDPVSASVIITFREVLSTMKLFGFESGKSLAVLGQGTVGLSFIRFAKLLGMGPVIALGRKEDKLRQAREMGADATVNILETDPVSAVRALCPEGVDYALDAAGVPAFLNQALGMIKPDARICVYGISGQMQAEVDWSRCPYNWTLQFNQFPSKRLEAEALPQILAWMRLGVLDPAAFVSQVYPFAQIGEAFQRVERGDTNLKFVIKF